MAIKKAASIIRKRVSFRVPRNGYTGTGTVVGKTETLKGYRFSIREDDTGTLRSLPLGCLTLLA
jgi:hypothetical protein